MGLFRDDRETVSGLHTRGVETFGALYVSRHRRNAGVHVEQDRVARHDAMDGNIFRVANVAMDVYRHRDDVKRSSV